MIFNINFSFLLTKQQKTSHLQMNQIPKRKKKVSVEAIVPKLKISDVKVLTFLKDLLRSPWVCDRSARCCKGDTLSLLKKKKVSFPHIFLVLISNLEN